MMLQPRHNAVLGLVVVAATSVICQAEIYAEINEKLGRVPCAATNAKFARCVIMRISMVVIVPTLSNGAKRYEQILRWIDSGIVGTVAEKMCKTVHTPSHVQHPHVTENTSQPETVPCATKEITAKGGDAIAHHKDSLEVVLPLPHYHRIIQEIAHINFLARRLDIAMLGVKNPAAVGKPKST